MRRVLFTAFLSLTAFSVLGGNFHHVTAPPAGVHLEELQSQQGGAIAPGQWVQPPYAGFNGGAAPSQAEFNGQSVFNGHVAATGSSEEAPIEVREDASDIGRWPDAAAPLFLSVWTEIPLAAAHLAGLTREQSVDGYAKDIRPVSSKGSDRENSVLGRLPVYISEIFNRPSSDISLRATYPAPERPKSELAVFNRENTHGSSVSEGGPVPVERYAALDRETFYASPGASPIVAFTEAPSSDIALRETLELPAPRKLEVSQFKVGDHSASITPIEVSASRYAATLTERDPFRNEVPNFLQTSYGITGSEVVGRSFFNDPQAPLSKAFASYVHGGSENSVFAAQERTGSEMAADAFAIRIPTPIVTALQALAPGTALLARSTDKLPPPPAGLANGHSFQAQSLSVEELQRGPGARAESVSDTLVTPLVTAFAELPGTIIEAMRPGSVPSPPVYLAASHRGHNFMLPTPVSDRGTGDALEGEPSIPATITANTSMSPAMLSPMNREVLVDAPLSEENSAALSGQLGAGLRLESQFDRALAPSGTGRASAPTPLLISGKPEFSMDLLKPMNASVANPFVKLSGQEEIAAIKQDGGYCDPNWVGPPIRFSQTVELKLDDLLRQLHQRFGVNFIVGKGVADLPMNVKAGSIPWNVLLRSQLFVSGVRARCIDTNTIELIENREIPSLQDMADVETRFVKLKFLQRTGSGTVDLANRSQGGQNGNQGGGCGGNNQGGTSGSVQGGGGQGGNQGGQTAGQLASNKFDKLIIEIEKILGLRSMTESTVGSGSGSGGQGTQVQQTEVVRTNRFVTQIPGRNILAIRATKEEHELIDQIIARADRPPFQVVIKGLVYTANQDRLRDIGVETTITGGTADGRTSGGIFGDTLGTGTLFDFSTIIGTFDFNVQATAFQQNGVISVKSRPFATVIDGLCTTLDVGRQLPIIIDSTLGGQGDVVFVNAANNLAVTPYVIDDDNGNPMAVTLELRLTANDIDSSVTARGVPAISARSIQTQLLLNEDKTAILGGFTVDSDSRTFRKTPGLGDIPIIGELFRRRIRDTRVNRLYFAISVDVITYPDAIRPVDVPGATTQPPTLTPEMLKRSEKAEPKQVVPTPTPQGP